MSRLFVSLFVLVFAVSTAGAMEPQTVSSHGDAPSHSALSDNPSPAKAEDGRSDGAIVRQPATGVSKALLPLFVSFASLQALDVHSTLRAVNRGGTEGNLFMQPFAARPAAFIALKAGVTAGLILADARLSRKHRIAAFAVMLAANGAYAAIVAHNYRVAAAPTDYETTRPRDHPGDR